MSVKPIIFSDFDGTITERDVIVMIMDKFAPPEWTHIKAKILYERTITLKDGVEKLFSLIESSKKAQIIDFVKKEVKLRAGFIEFLDFCQANEIRILIGDSLTDLAPSKVADVVFARADLIKYLKEENISYIQFNDFYEVQEQLRLT